MKKYSLLIILSMSLLKSNAQNIDAFLSESQTIDLVMSTPQPRIGQIFQLTLDINHVRANIFRSLMGKLELEENDGSQSNGEMTMTVKASAKGMNEIAPITFIVNKTKYTTNGLKYEVIDALPVTDKGVWFRKVMTSDSTFCIIIEQRIPAKENVVTSGNTTSIKTEAETEEMVGFKPTYSITGLDGTNSMATTSFSSIEINGEDKSFKYGYAVYHFAIADKKAKIIITKDKFDNLPAGYKFVDIVVQ